MRKVRLRVDWPQVLGQRRSGRPEVGRIHDFKVLLVLLGGSTGQLIDPLTQVPGVLHSQEVIERGEKVIVPRLFRGGNKRPHGEYVDQLVVEPLIGECVGGTLALVATNRLRRQTTRGGRRLVKREGLGLDAEIVFHSLADEAFRVHGARQVGVQIGALGHVMKKGVKGKRSLAAGTLEGLSGAGFAIMHCGLGLRHDSWRKAEQQRGKSNMEPCGGPWIQGLAQANWGGTGRNRAQTIVHFKIVRLRPGFPVRGSVCGFQ